MSKAETVIIVAKPRIYPNPALIWVMLPVAIVVFGGLAIIGSTAWISGIGVSIGLMWALLFLRSHTETRTVRISMDAICIQQAGRTVDTLPLNTATHIRFRKSWYGKSCYTAIRAGKPGWHVIASGKASEAVFIELKSRLSPSLMEERRESLALGVTGAILGTAGVTALITSLVFGKTHKPEANLALGAYFGLIAIAMLADMMQCGGEWRHDPNFRSWRKNTGILISLTLHAASSIYR